MIRIARSTFPSRLTRKGNVNYLNVPAQVVERMELREGEYLDVTITFPDVREIETVEKQENKEN